MPLFQAENLAVGQVIPLPGCTVSSVKLLARDGRKVATARLGQSGGMRAVRVEAAPHLQMEDMDNLGAAAVGQLSGLDGMDAAPAMEMGADLSFAPEVDSADPPAFDMAAMDAPAEVALDVGEAADPAPLSWDDEDLEATPETGEAARERYLRVALNWKVADRCAISPFALRSFPIVGANRAGRSLLVRWPR